MARERLTSKTAEDWMKSKPGTQVEDKGSGIDNDVYSMNCPDHEKNDPKYDAYAKGDPSAWAEDVDKSNLWKKDKRNEMHVPEMTAKQAAEAVAAAKKLEEKAIKCIVASQRMLPGASDDLIEAQAADFMHLPENSVNATLSRQENLAQLISKAASGSADDAEDEGEDSGSADDESEDSGSADDESEDSDKSAGDTGDESEDSGSSEDEGENFAEKMKRLRDMKKKAAKLASEIEAIKKDQEKEHEAASEDEDENENENEDENEGTTEAGKSCEASESSLLDEIFSSVTASDSKKGAKTLKGMVNKQASEGADPLNGMWGGAPDVSRVFK